MKLRGRREAVAQEAERGAGGQRRQHAGGVAVEREGDHRERRRAEITQTPAARPSTPSMRLITLITATIPITVPTSPRSIAPIAGRSKVDRAGIERAEERQGEALDRARPAATGIDRRRRSGRAASAPAGRSKTSSTTPTTAITTAPPRIARVSRVPGQADRGRRPATATRIARPPSRGVGVCVQARARSGSRRSPRCAAPATPVGAPAPAPTTARTKARRASSRRASVRSSQARSRLARARSDRTRA